MTTELADLVGVLVDGWTERVEYFKRVTTHHGVCAEARKTASKGQLRHWECPCPVALETRVRSARQAPLLEQLAKECTGFAPSTANSLSGTRPGKPKSKPPSNLDAVDLTTQLETVLVAVGAEGATTAERLRYTVDNSDFMIEPVRKAYIRDLSRFVRSARVVLGYED